jgi:hypothetical protein
MKALCDADVVRLIREEWQAKLDALSEQLDIVMKSKVGKEGEKSLISRGLKVRHKKSQIRYTVSSVGPKDVILKTPEGDEFLVDKESFESHYQLD